MYSSGGTTLKLFHRKRGKEAIVGLNIIPRYGGVILHDCWASYLANDNCGHGPLRIPPLAGACVYHRLEPVPLGLQYEEAVAGDLPYCVPARGEAPYRQGVCSLQKRYRNILTRGNKELPVIPPKPQGKRGRSWNESWDGGRLSLSTVRARTPAPGSDTGSGDNV